MSDLSTFNTDLHSDKAVSAAAYKATKKVAKKASVGKAPNNDRESRSSHSREPSVKAGDDAFGTMRKKQTGNNTGSSMLGKAKKGGKKYSRVSRQESTIMASNHARESSNNKGHSSSNNNGSTRKRPQRSCSQVSFDEDAYAMQSASSDEKS